MSINGRLGEYDSRQDIGINPPEMISWENDDINAADASQAKALDTFFMLLDEYHPSHEIIL
jgi:hypothetical protein